MEEESIPDANNVTADTFSHTPNTERENGNAIFTSENRDKSDKMADTLKDLTINNSKYYTSNSETASDKQGNLKCDPKMVTHTSNGREKFTDNSNGNFEQKLSSNGNLPVVVPTMKPRIDNMIAPIGGAYQALLTTTTKEVTEDAASGGAWVNQTLRKVI